MRRSYLPRLLYAVLLLGLARFIWHTSWGPNANYELVVASVVVLVAQIIRPTAVAWWIVAIRSVSVCLDLLGHSWGLEEYAWLVAVVACLWVDDAVRSEGRSRVDSPEDVGILLAAGCFLVFVAEVAASWWLWTKAPTDSIRVWYPGFSTYEAGRFSGWWVLFVGGVIVSILSFRGLSRRWHWLVATVLALGLELSTSTWYWAKPASANIRGLYESVWYWDRIPLPAEKGWPSLWGYAFDHAFVWGVVMLVGVAILRLHRRRRAIELMVR